MNSSIESGKLRLLAVLLLILGICSITIGQDPQEQSEEEKVLTPIEQKMLMRISVDFRETPIDDVIRALAKQADLDVVKGPEVTGNVTATLTNVPLEEALSHILTAYGWGYVTSENMIRIVPASQLTEEAEKLETKIYRIVYADVTEVEKALRNVISKRGSLSSSPATSNIIVTDTESKIQAIDSFLEEIDRITPQILVEARIYDITNTDALDLGIQWTAGTRTNYNGTTTDSDIIVSRSGSNEYISSRTEPYMTGTLESSIKKTSGTTGTLRFGILNENIDISTLITAQQEESAAKLLANPRILVLDNETASFKAIREIPYQQLQQGGYQSFGTTEFKEVGVELKVTPHIAKDGMIRLHIVPVFSAYVRDVTLTLAGADITMPQPVVDRREADTIALVEDGQTVVIGGLRKQEVTTEMSKIPLLGDIPLLGLLFRFEGEETVTNELVVFITPRIVEEPVLTETETEHLKATEIRSPKSPSSKINPGKEQISKPETIEEEIIVEEIAEEEVTEEEATEKEVTE